MSEVTALGMIETIGLVSALEAADAGLKAAQVRLLGTDYVRGGLVMVRFEGDVAAVQAAVDAGTSSAQRVGNVFSAHVIPRAVPEVFCVLALDPSQGPAKRAGKGCSACGGCEGGKREALQGNQEEPAPDLDTLASWKVVDLRRYARRLHDFPLSPNEIRYANKALLLENLQRHLKC